MNSSYPSGMQRQRHGAILWTMLLKSVPGMRGTRRITSLPASRQRRAHVSAAAWPAPLSSWSTRMVRASIPASTGKSRMLPAAAACPGGLQQRAAMHDVGCGGEHGFDAFANDQPLRRRRHLPRA